MKRPSVNAAIDALAIGGFVFLTATGVLLRYVLPPGSGLHTTVWGLSRHAWGGIHFWIAVVFLTTLTIHLVVHRRWIASIVRGRPHEGSGYRAALGLVGLFAILGIAAAPFVSPVEQVPHGPRSHRGQALRPGAIEGSMTLSEVAEGAGVSVGELIARLGLPSETSPDATLDQLADEHDLHLRDVRQVVREIRARSEP